jgi:hypothetical protein
MTIHRSISYITFRTIDGGMSIFSRHVEMRDLWLVAPRNAVYVTQSQWPSAVTTVEDIGYNKIDAAPFLTATARHSHQLVVSSRRGKVSLESDESLCSEVTKAPEWGEFIRHPRVPFFSFSVSRAITGLPLLPARRGPEEIALRTARRTIQLLASVGSMSQNVDIAAKSPLIIAKESSMRLSSRASLLVRAKLPAADNAQYEKNPMQLHATTTDRSKGRWVLTFSRFGGGLSVDHIVQLAEKRPSELNAHMEIKDVRNPSAVETKRLIAILSGLKLTKEKMFHSLRQFAGNGLTLASEKKEG